MDFDSRSSDPVETKQFSREVPPNRFPALVAGGLVLSYQVFNIWFIINLKLKLYAIEWPIFIIYATLLLAGYVWLSILESRQSTVVSALRTKGMMVALAPLLLVNLVFLVNNGVAIIGIAMFALLLSWHQSFDVSRHISVMSGVLDQPTWRRIIFSMQSILIMAATIVAISRI